MQPFKFRTIEEFLEFLPEDEYIITSYLRSIVFDLIPEVQEKLRYQVPFYSRHRNICFIWPGSVLWGKQRSYEGVRFGFSAGYLLDGVGQYLERGTRKQVYWKDFTRLEEIDTDHLIMLVSEAVIVDDTLAKVRKSKS